MTATQVASAYIATVVALWWLASWALDRWHRPRTTRRFQQSARQAARDVASHRRQREIALLEAWLVTPYRSRNAIPHQTRRTEEDQ